MTPTTTIRALLLTAVMVGSACGAADDTEDEHSEAADARPPTIDASSDASSAPDAGGAPSCGPPELCSRTIGECGVELTQSDCEGWYQNDASCADMEGYTACNCSCVEEATCDEYFSCGMTCFEDWC